MIYDPEGVADGPGLLRFLGSILASSDKHARSAQGPEPFYGHTPETPKEILASREQAQSNLVARRDPKQVPHRLTSMIPRQSLIVG
jgi:hypothetical protein